MSAKVLTLTLGRRQLPTYPPLYVSRTLSLELADAGGCAWRARYLYLNGRKVAHLSVDPNNGVTPTLSGSVLGHDFRIPLPTLRFKSNMGPLHSRAYGVVSRFWHNVDGRYGWGTEQGGLPLWDKEGK